MPAFFDGVGWHRFREHAPEYTNDETFRTIMSINARMGGFPDDVSKWCLLIYNSASLLSEAEL